MQSSVDTTLVRPQSSWGDYNNVQFAISQAMLKMQTVTLVQVKSCTNAGGLVPVGYVDVQPLVTQVDGKGRAVPHGIIHNLPYLRVQGGANAVIIDPQPGDIGICLFASRDISGVKATKQQSPPLSLRSHSFSDGLYIGGLLNAAPTQYVAFNSGGIVIHSPGTVTIDAPTVAITGSNLTHNGINIGSTHKHSGVQSGGSNTGNPV